MEGEEVLLLTIRIIMKCANIDDQKIVELVDWHESGQDNPTDNAMAIYHKYNVQRTMSAVRRHEVDDPSFQQYISILLHLASGCPIPQSK